MTGVEIAVSMGLNPVLYKSAAVECSKRYFLLNLIRNLTFSDRDIQDAVLCDPTDEGRRILRTILGLPHPGSCRIREPVLAEPFDRTVMPVSLMADENRDIKKRVLAFLHPDPKMSVEIEKIQVQVEPSLNVYQVYIEDGRGGGWAESFASEELLRAFLRGIRVTFAMSDLQKILPEFGDDAPLVFSEVSSVKEV